MASHTRDPEDVAVPEDVVAWARANTCQAEVNQLLHCARELETFSAQSLLDQGLRRVRIAVLSGHTSKPVLDAVRVYALARKIYVEFLDPGFGQYEVAIRSRDSQIESFAPDFVYLMVGSEQVDLSVDCDAARWQELWECCQRWLGCEIIQNTFVEPDCRVNGHHELKRPESATVKIRRLNLRLGEVAPGYVHLVDVDFVSRTHGRSNWRDQRLFDLAKLPVCYPAVPHYAQQVASVISAAVGRSKKCLVVDLDNTLWGGVVGELGWERVLVGVGNGAGESFTRLQQYLLELKQRGILLAVCSKNDDRAAREPFENRTDMLLGLNDFAAFYANWDDKVTNLRRIAADLNIATDSLALLDDNPVERAFVSQSMPEVGVVDIGNEPADYAHLLSVSGFFEPIAITSDDRNRTAQYHAQVSRRKFEESSGERDDFLAGLDMVATIRPFRSADLARVSQLINKTTQFNLTGVRYTEPQLTDLLTDENTITRCVSLTDKFGDNGTVSAVIGILRDSRLSLDAWVMSCRVIKRGVERTLFRSLVADMRSMGVREIIGCFRPTDRNVVAANLFSSLGFQELESSDGSVRYRIEIDGGDLAVEQEPEWIRIQGSASSVMS